MSIRPKCVRTLLIVNTKTRKVIHTRDEDMNGCGMSCARITKPLYGMLRDGNHVAYYAHSPHILRVPTEINGRYFVKPPKA